MHVSRDGSDWGFQENEEKTHTEKRKNSTQTGFSAGEAAESWKSDVHYIELNREAGLLHTAGQEGVIITYRSIRKRGFGIQLDQGHRFG